MKVIAIIISLVCISHGALADDLASPSPTPVYPTYIGRHGSVRRLEQVDRRRAIEAESKSRAQARAQERANRRSTAAAQAQAREAGRAREQAQRQVAAQNRIEARNETPRPNSELMTRMGFSKQEISAQKACEESAKAGSKETPGATSSEEQQQPKPAADTGAATQKPTPSPAKANGAPSPQPSA